MKIGLFLSGLHYFAIAAMANGAGTGEISPQSGALHAGERDVQITLGYWNDNFLFDKLSGANQQRNRDDFHTASFWVQVADERAGKWRIYDANFSILTDKAGQFRTDLLAVRLSGEFAAPSGTLQAGLGLAANGDFGGSSIQNGYHRMFGYRKVTLPYSVKSRLGVLALLRYKPVILKSGNTRLGGYVSNYLRTAIIPCNSRAGVDFNTVRDIGDCTVHFQTIAGYSGYYGGTKPLTVLFENGFTWGMLFSGGIKGAPRAAVWYTNNQYGLRQYQFGISLTAGWNGGRMSDLNEVTFP